MDNTTIQQLIEAGLPGSQVRVSGDGHHFQAIVVSEAFAGKTMIQEQKMVYATLGDKITSGEIHALSIKAYTPQEWETARELHVL